MPSVTEAAGSTCAFGPNELFNPGHRPWCPFRTSPSLRVQSGLLFAIFAPNELNKPVPDDTPPSGWRTETMQSET